MHIPRGTRHFFSRKAYFFFFFWCTLCLFSYLVLWCFELCLVSMFCCSHCIVFMCWTCIHFYAIMLYWLHIRMIIFFAMWSLWSFPHECFVFNQVAHIFHIMFTWLHFYLFNYFCPFITLFTLASNVFYASVSRYEYCVSSSL